ncbi:MAG: nucleotidyltransferase domain-containing protein [Aigarchaeota archaeon]|nr:nucleotidyltransferase domain-containing protein [Candidatus Pelearchaeum maunauluense]
MKIYYAKYSRDDVIQIIRDGIQHLKNELPLRYVILFGSYAEGRNTVASDVDILVVYDGRKVGDDYLIVRKVIRLPNLQPHIYTMEEYEELRQTKGSIVEIALKRGIRIL